jgi:hypothetical protein
MTWIVPNGFVLQVNRPPPPFIVQGGPQMVFGMSPVMGIPQVVIGPNGPHQVVIGPNGARQVFVQQPQIVVGQAAGPQFVMVDKTQQKCPHGPTCIYQPHCKKQH